MIDAGLSALPDRDLTVLIEGFTWLRRQPQPAARAEFLRQLIGEMQNELDDRVAALEAIEADVDGEGEIADSMGDAIADARAELRRVLDEHRQGPGL